jgi:hypothetical protein
VFPEINEVHIFEASGAVRRFSDGGTVESTVIAGLRIDLDQIFAE